MTQHFPDLPERGMLTNRDRICSSSLPCAGDRKGIKRVFHEAGPVAFVGPGRAEIRCIHCARDFSRPENTDKTLTGAA